MNQTSKTPLALIFDGKWLTEGIMLMAVTSWAYFTAFLYELGQLNAYGIPSELVDVGLVNIIFSLLAAFSFIASYLFLVVQVIKFKDILSDDPIIDEVYFGTVFATALILPFVLIYGLKHNATWFVIGAVMLGYTIRFMIFGIKKQLKGISIRDQLIEESSGISAEDSIVLRCLKEIGITKLIFFIIVGVQLFGAYNLGVVKAENKVIYPILELEGSFAIVKFNNSKILAVPYNANLNSLSEGFKIFDYSQLSSSQSNFVNTKTQPVGDRLFIEHLRRK